MALALAGCASPYAGEETRSIKALSAAEQADLLAGRGMGLARAAELNGLPGPMHVLELRDRLALDGEQLRASETIFIAMRVEARRLGALIVEAEWNLDGDFAARRVDAESLRAQSARIANWLGELRATHLAAHLAMMDVLRPEQVARYAALRGYATAH
jgi:hypothetical protein